MEQETQLYIDQGTNFSFPMALTDNNGVSVDLSTAVVLSQMRAGYQSATAYDFTCTGNVNGNVVLSMSHTITSSIKPGRYVFDAFYIINSIPTKFLTGLAFVLPSSTLIPN